MALHGRVGVGSGLPHLPGRTAPGAGVRASSVPEILELQGDGEILRAHRADDGLQVVLALTGDADLLALDLRGDFQLETADEASDLPGHRGLDALLDSDHLPGVAEW